VAWAAIEGGCSVAAPGPAVETTPSHAESLQTASAIPVLDVIDTARLTELLKPSPATAVVVNFWATWCPPCVKEMPELVQFYRTCAAHDVRFVSVSVDHPDTLDERVKPFFQQNALPFSVHVLSERSPGNVSKALGVEWTGAVPATLLFDKNGKLVQSWFEETTRRDLEKAADSLRSK
jgi:peroxiredoxin